LQVGEVVVTDGQDKLQNGAKVETRARSGNSGSGNSNASPTTNPRPAS
jgi:hypothetical protein